MKKTSLPRYPKLTPAEAQDFLKKSLRNGKTGELNKIVVQLCQAKRIDHSILHQQYQNKMEEMMSKFPNSAKMKAKYDVYLKKSHLIIQTIKNSL